MKQRRIVELKENETFAGVLWLVSGSIRTTKRGDPYWEGKFNDSSGSISAKLWDSSQGKHGRVEALKDVLVIGGPVSIRAKVGAFNKVLQLDLLSAERVDPGQFDPSIFSPAGKRSREEMEAEFDATVASMEDAGYRGLMEAFRKRREFFDRFAVAPAAKGIHHAWIGGLFEHSLALARNVKALTPGYPLLDEDLLLCACFLHDAGKAVEISSDPGFEYTTKGKLLGHIYMGARLVESLSREVDALTEEKELHLVHIVLSHQGERSDGFGSPVDPLTPEAVFFHQLDNLDAKIQNSLTQMSLADEKGGDEDFTNPRDNFLRKGYYRVRPSGEKGGAVEKAEPEKAEKTAVHPPGEKGGGLFGQGG